MKNADDSNSPRNILPDDSDLGPEPSWLLEDDVQDEPSEQEPDSSRSSHSDADKTPRHQSGTESNPDASPASIVEGSEPRVIESTSETSQSTADDADTVSTRNHAWLWGLAPFVLLLATGLIAWFGTTQTLNGLATWDAIRNQAPPLLPARWAMMIWWLVLPLMMLFLIYGSLPAGREITRIKITGPLVSIALGATTLWIFAQHWQWSVIGIASMGVAAIATLATYFLMALNPNIKNLRQRIIAIIPLSAALGYSVMLTVLAWQSYSNQPFGERGSSVLFALLAVILAAVFAFFLRDGLLSLVLVIWFAGVVQQQWGEDGIISLIAAVAVLFSAALAVLGTLLAMESHQPSLTASVENRRGRTSFFKRSENSTQE